MRFLAGIPHTFSTIRIIMASTLQYSKLVLIVAALFAAAISLSSADDAFICSRATYYGSPDCYGNPNGACGYGEYGRTVNNGVISGVSRLYRNGSGCGGCYQVRCKIPAHCSEEGTQVVVTDYGAGADTDFVMNERAYASMARPNMVVQLFAYGVVDVEYRRIPCRYGYNLMIKVHERSSCPGYLAIAPIYQAGIYDIIAVQIWQEDCKEWRWMRRVYGAVFDMENPSVGPTGVNLRMQVSGGANGEVKWVQIANAIPANWKAGDAYDTAIQLD